MYSDIQTEVLEETDDSINGDCQTDVKALRDTLRDRQRGGERE